MLSSKVTCHALFFLLILNFGEFQAVTLALVFDLEKEGEQEGEHAERREYDHRDNVSSGRFTQGTYEQRNEAETDVLYPENEAICAAEHFLVDDLGNTGPKSRRNQREGKSEQKDEHH